MKPCWLLIAGDCLGWFCIPTLTSGAGGGGLIGRDVLNGSGDRDGAHSIGVLMRSEYSMTSSFRRTKQGKLALSGRCQDEMPAIQSNNRKPLLSLSIKRGINYLVVTNDSKSLGFLLFPEIELSAKCKFPWRHGEGKKDLKMQQSVCATDVKCCIKHVTFTEQQAGATLPEFELS